MSKIVRRWWTCREIAHLKVIAATAATHVIARALGRTEESVKRMIVRLGMTPITYRRYWTTGEESRLAEMVSSGLLVEDMSRELERSAGSVRYKLKDMGLEARRQLRV